MKGLVYVAAHDYYNESVPGGWAAIRERAPEPLKSFMQEHYLPGGLYDAFPVVEISSIAASLCRVSHAQCVRDAAAWTARRDGQGVYKFFLSVTSCELVATRLPRLSMQYFDFGSADGRIVRDKVLESTRSGIPAPMASWFTWCVEGFTPIPLQLAGAKQVIVRSSPPRPDGEAHGTTTVRIGFTITWS